MTSNMKTVDELVEFIRDRVQRSNKRWWEIAVAFAEAKEMYGVGSDLFKSLCTRTEFGISKAQKLAAIAGLKDLENMRFNYLQFIVGERYMQLKH